MNNLKINKRIIIIGSGYTGLSAALNLSDYDVSIFDSDAQVGGLAGTFKTRGQLLEKFYHHWFSSEFDFVRKIAKDLNLEKYIVSSFTNTGMYFNSSFFKLSSPLDLLLLKPLSFISRIRLAFLVLYARRIKNYKKLEGFTAEKWLKKLGGEQAYRIMWEPLLVGKFGPYAKKVSAVWFWNKIALRGSTRGKGGKESLMYYKGGFSEFTNAIKSKILKNGSKFYLRSNVTQIVVKDNKAIGIKVNNKFISCDYILCTTSLPIFKKLLNNQKVDKNYLKSLSAIKYIGNLCLILELKKSLSDFYWININDPSFPFVGLIEHTNFINSENYGKRHIVYLTKYLPTSSFLYKMSKEDYLNYAMPFIQKMFPEFNKKYISKSYLWRCEHSQPIAGLNYSNLIPETKTPITNLFLSTMAQVYPVDRGTNQALKQGYLASQEIKKIHNSEI